MMRKVFQQRLPAPTSVRRLGPMQVSKLPHRAVWRLPMSAGPAAFRLAPAGNRAIQRLAQEESFEVPDEIEERLEVERGRGEPVETNVKVQMESALGADLGDVRIHRDAEAAALSESLSARAFTDGEDVYFGPGEYAPASPLGQRVLAHELAHVVQQHSAPKLRVGSVHDPAEDEADRVADQVVSRLAHQTVDFRRQSEEQEEEEVQALRRQANPDKEEQTLTQVVDEEEPPAPTAEAQPPEPATGAAPAGSVTQDVGSQSRETGSPVERARAEYNEGQQAYRAGDYTAALERFKRIIDTPGLPSEVYAPMMYNAALCYRHMGDRDAAIAMVQQMLGQPGLSDEHRTDGERLLRQLAGTSEAAGQVGQVEQGGAEATAAAPTRVEAPLPTEPNARGRALFQRGAAAYRAGNFAEAASCFSRVFDISGLEPSTYGTMYYNLARAYQRMGNLPMALTMARAFLSQEGISAADRADGADLLRELAGAGAGTEETASKVPEAGAAAGPPPAAPSGATPLPSDPIARAQALYAQAQQAYVSNRPAEALALYNQVQATPGLPAGVYATTLWNIARCHEALGNYRAAIAMLRAFLGQPNVSDADRAEANAIIARLQRR